MRGGRVRPHLRLREALGRGARAPADVDEQLPVRLEHRAHREHVDVPGREHDLPLVVRCSSGTRSEREKGWRRGEARGA